MFRWEKKCPAKIVKPTWEIAKLSENIIQICKRSREFLIIDKNPNGWYQDVAYHISRHSHFHHSLVVVIQRLFHYFWCWIFHLGWSNLCLGELFHFGWCTSFFCWSNPPSQLFQPRLFSIELPIQKPNNPSANWTNPQSFVSHHPSGGKAASNQSICVFGKPQLETEIDKSHPIPVKNLHQFTFPDWFFLGFLWSNTPMTPHFPSRSSWGTSLARQSSWMGPP